MDSGASSHAIGAGAYPRRMIFSRRSRERIMSDADDKAQGLALAGGVIMVALLETLVEKNLLSAAEVRALLSKALLGIGPHARSAGGYEASRAIAAIMRERFPESRG
jgi:hypothetical protein